MTQVDDYLYVGTAERMDYSEEFLKSTFEVVTEPARSAPLLLGCDITRHEDGAITLSKHQNLAVLDLEVLRDAIGDSKDAQTTARQATLYRHLIGKIMFIRRFSSPVMLMRA